MKHRTQGQIWAALLALLILSPQAQLHAVGLTSGFAKVKIENLQPGRTYRASRFFREINVVNASDDPCQMKMEVTRPRPDDLDPGFEAVPDITWGVLQKDTFELGPWDEAKTDFLLTIPMDKKHLGKKYQIHVWSKATGGTAVGVGLMHKLLFTVAEEINPESGKEPIKVLPFKLQPFEYIAKNIKFNRPIDLYEQSGTAMVLQNPNNRECRYRLEVIPYHSAPIVNLKEYEPAPQRNWLTVGPNEVTVGPKQEYRVPLVITLPRNPNFRNKRYLFLVRATLLDDESPLSVLARVYVTTSERLLD